MCDTSLATLAISAVSTGAGLYAGKQTADAQRQAQERTAELQKQQYINTMRAYQENLAQVEIQKTQAARQAAQKVLVNNEQATAAAATARVAAGENGISGLSVGAMLQEIAGKRDGYNTSVQTNLGDSVNSLEAQKKNLFNTTSSQLNSMGATQSYIAQPDYLGSALKIGSAALDYYKTSQGTKPR